MRPIERNSVLPEKIPDSGLIILRDGDPGEPEQCAWWFWERAYYQARLSRSRSTSRSGDPAARDTAFDALLQQIGVALEADPTLGDLAFGMTYGRPGAGN